MAEVDLSVINTTAVEYKSSFLELFSGSDNLHAAADRQRNLVTTS